MHNTWWVTRPKRDIRGIVPILAVFASQAEGRKWSYPDKRTELAIESALEEAGLKRKGRRRDQQGGGARTYRAWLKSLGLIFMDTEDRMWTTLAGSLILQGEPPLPIMSKLVLSTQFPSAFSASGPSKVADRFHVRPFVFLLQLLRHPDLHGYLDERDEIAKIVIAYGEDNSDECVDSVVDRILEHRRRGDSSLEPDYVERFKSSRTQASSIEHLTGNFRDIANTLANQLSLTQLVTVQQGGRWEITTGAEDAVDEAISVYRDLDLIQKPQDEEFFQRKFGVPPGRTKDNRSLIPGAQSVGAAAILEKEITSAFLAMSASRVITALTPEICDEIARRTGASVKIVDRVLARKFRAGGIDTFMTEYAVLAFGSRENAAAFEEATASIFSDIFGFKVARVGSKGIRPDVVISSPVGGYAAILDAKAYGVSYSATHDHRNRMVRYIREYREYAIDDNPLAFFGYVVSEYKPTIDGQLADISREAQIPGSAITARDIIRMVERHKTHKYTHEEIRRILSKGRGLTSADLMLDPEVD